MGFSKVLYMNVYRMRIEDFWVPFLGVRIQGFKLLSFGCRVLSLRVIIGIVSGLAIWDPELEGQGQGDLASILPMYGT